MALLRVQQALVEICDRYISEVYELISILSPVRSNLALTKML